MKNNNKGFTLIELLATIVILGVVTGLTVGITMGFIDNAKRNTYQTTRSNIEKMAGIYLQENVDKINFVEGRDYEYQCIKVKHLIESGYFDNQILKSPIEEGKNVNEDMYVFVSRNKETKTINESSLVYKENLNVHCDYINSTLDKDITLDYVRGWQKEKDLTITYLLSNVTDYEQINENDYVYKVNEDNNIKNRFDNKTIVKTIKITKPSTVMAAIHYEGEVVLSKTVDISQIDNIAPKINELSGDTKYEQSKNITVTIQDSGSSESGISGFNSLDSSLTVKYGWSTSKTTEPTGYSNGVINYSACNSENTECKIATFQANGSGYTGEYYLWIKPNMHDQAGNVVDGIVSTGTYKFDNEKPVVNISRKDYNTFDYSESTDNIGITYYHINTTGTAPTVSSTWVTTKTYDISSENTYYVWAKDAAGNVSDSKNIKAYTVSRSQGVGTTLTTRYDATSSSNENEFTSNTVMLAGTSVWASSKLNTGYNSVVLKVNGKVENTNGYSLIVNNNVTINSEAVANVATININKDGVGYSGLTVVLYQGGSSKYTSSSALNGVYGFSTVVNGTYDVYVDGSDTGTDVTVSNTGNVTINYYTLTLNTGTGISSVTGNGIYVSGKKVAINAYADSSYTFTNWTKTIGNEPVDLNNASTTVTITMTTTLTANAKILDDAPPIITFNPNGNTTWAKSHSSVVTVTDDSGVAEAKYLWSTSNTADASNGTVFTSGDKITKSNGTGKFYLCVYAKDNFGNVENECSKVFNIDNTAPTCKINVESLYNQGVKITITGNDSNMSKVAGYSFDGGTTWNATTRVSTVTSGRYVLRVKDNVGNIRKCGNVTITQACKYTTSGKVTCTQKDKFDTRADTGSSFSYSTRSAAESACRICSQSGFVYSSGCTGTVCQYSAVCKNSSNVEQKECVWTVE